MSVADIFLTLGDYLRNLKHYQNYCSIMKKKLIFTNEFANIEIYCDYVHQQVIDLVYIPDEHFTPTSLDAYNHLLRGELVDEKTSENLLRHTIVNLSRFSLYFDLNIFNNCFTGEKDLRMRLSQAKNMDDLWSSEIIRPVISATVNPTVSDGKSYGELYEMIMYTHSKTNNLLIKIVNMISSLPQLGQDKLIQGSVRTIRNYLEYLASQDNTQNQYLKLTPSCSPLCETKVTKDFKLLLDCEYKNSYGENKTYVSKLPVEFDSVLLNKQPFDFVVIQNTEIVFDFMLLVEYYKLYMRQKAVLSLNGLLWSSVTTLGTRLKQLRKYGLVPKLESVEPVLDVLSFIGQIQSTVAEDSRDILLLLNE